MKKTLVGLVLVLAASGAWAGEYDDEDRDERRPRSWADINAEQMREIDRDLERLEQERRQDAQEHREKMMLFEMERLRDAVERGNYPGYPYSR
jgi:hypothetical protein